GRTNLTLIGTDALAAKSRLAPELADAVRAASGRTGGRCLLVANLPYQIASPLLLDLLLSDLGVRRFCFTVQKEVADRIASPPGRKSYSPLSIVIQAVCDVTHVADLPASVFWPRPKIASTMLRLDFSEAKAARIADRPHFVHVVRTCFLHRRKQLAHAVAYLFGRKKLDTVEAFGGMDLTRRPEALSVEEWIALAERVPRESPA
ncbi:MAG: ribosomal RNA small subunit methyltransferase A, partial [Phycisphaerae bacterium]|nr:ribosomal RNA small subunit methyltransferase A [Phycisphaerae bacterium]